MIKYQLVYSCSMSREAVRDRRCLVGYKLEDIRCQRRDVRGSGDNVVQVIVVHTDYILSWPFALSSTSRICQVAEPRMGRGGGRQQQEEARAASANPPSRPSAQTDRDRTALPGRDPRAHQPG